MLVCVFFAAWPRQAGHDDAAVRGGTDRSVCEIEGGHGGAVPLRSEIDTTSIRCKQRSIDVEVAVLAADLDLGAEEVAEAGGGEHFVFATVGYDLSIAQKNHAFDLGDDFRDVMRHEQNSEAGLGELAHGLAELHLCADVERVAGFVEEQRLRIVSERTGYQRALGFSRRHMNNAAVGEMRDS